MVSKLKRDPLTPLGMTGRKLETISGDWNTLWSLLESQRFRSRGDRLTKEHFLIVVVQGLNEKVSSIKSRCSLDVIKDAREITILELDNKGVRDIVDELNCSDEIVFLLLCYIEKKGRKDCVTKLGKTLKKNGNLIRKNQIPQIISLPI